MEGVRREMAKIASLGLLDRIRVLLPLEGLEEHVTAGSGKSSPAAVAARRKRLDAASAALGVPLDHPDIPEVAAAILTVGAGGPVTVAAAPDPSFTAFRRLVDDEAGRWAAEAALPPPAPQAPDFTASAPAPRAWLLRPFSPAGRLARAGFWMWLAAVLAVRETAGWVARTVAVTVVAPEPSSSDPALMAFSVFVGLPLGVAEWIIVTAVTSRRVHDLDRRGWWALAVYASLAVAAVLDVPLTGRTGAYRLTILVGLGWLVWLGFTPGTSDPNRFGPDPRSARAPTDRSDSTCRSG